MTVAFDCGRSGIGSFVPHAGPKLDCSGRFDKLTMQFDKLTMQFDKLTMQFDKLTMQFDKQINNRVCRLCLMTERPRSSPQGLFLLYSNSRPGGYPEP